MKPTTFPWSGTAIAAAAYGLVPVILGALCGCSGRPPYTPYVPPTQYVLKVGGEEKRLASQTAQEVKELNANCTAAGCHVSASDPHEFQTLHLACVDCHGGDPAATTKEEAHPKPRHPERWPTAANPERSYTHLNEESWDWIRFVNPGDLRVANTTCGPCHASQVLSVMKSLMTTAAHFWGAAAYCNGIVSPKKTIFGESYSPEGRLQMAHTVWKDFDEKERDLKRGVVETIVPLTHWEVTQPGNVLRVFEKGSRLGGVGLGVNGNPTPLIGIPDKLEDGGRPNNRLSDRGLGTLNRVDLPILNLHKTRLNDPFLSFLGTNDNPGDYRSSGCTACHAVYANDRTIAHAGPYARYGNAGRSVNPDPTIPEGESGHPIRHQFTERIPSSQCMVCHMHQPNAFVNSFFGFQMWTYETDGEQMWPQEQKHPSHAEFVHGLDRNPEEAATRGRWGDPEFLKEVVKLNPGLKQTQFADYHGHGWIFRAVFKMDRKGNFLDADGKVIPFDDPDKFRGVIPLAPEVKGKDEKNLTPPDPYFAAESRKPGHAVHLLDIHAEKGMHCIDCHYTQDVHGNGKLYAEYQGAIEIKCEDCHGTVRSYATFTPSGPAANSSDRPTPAFTDMTTPTGKPRIYQDMDGRYFQNSMVDPDREPWPVVQVKDIVDPGKPAYNRRAARAKTLRTDGTTWVDGAGGNTLPASDADLAHRNTRVEGKSSMSCQSCHTSWITSCFGCHLPQKANMRTEMHHFETKHLRNYASYNPQVARDDVFLLGIEPDVQGNRISTVRSSSAILISSEDGQRQKIYPQIGTTAANGMSGQAFNTHFAHTVRTRETRQCSDCHLSEEGDNNAWLAQVYLQGTNFVNFIGYNAYVGCGSGGFHAVRVTEWEEPQAVIGSHLHRLAYPDWHRKHEERGRELRDAVHHSGTDIRSLQLRGEYLYTASGRGGFRVYDIANVANKGFSEKVVTSPVSPLGQDTHVPTRNATAVALPFNNPISMSRKWRPENREQGYRYKGKMQNLHELYRYAYVTDFEEGLIVVDIDCLTDGDPQNNFIRRAATFNPDDRLAGAVNLAVAGTTAYVCAAGGIYAISIDDPLAPRVIARVEAPAVNLPRSIAVQFRYAFVCDRDGVKVLDVTNPRAMKLVPGASVELPDARDIYVARTHGYVAAGAQGLVILDLEKPAAPRIDQIWNADGLINDLHQVKVGMTNDSVFAYLADGANGLRVAQLISPEDAGTTKRSAYGFSPRPAPKLIATYTTPEPALAVSKGLDRDRAVDESGNQVSIFGRIGGRPLRLDEMRRLYLKDGKPYTVSDSPASEK